MSHQVAHPYYQTTMLYYHVRKLANMLDRKDFTHNWKRLFLSGTIEMVVM